MNAKMQYLTYCEKQATRYNPTLQADLLETWGPVREEPYIQVMVLVDTTFALLHHLQSHLLYRRDGEFCYNSKKKIVAQFSLYWDLRKYFNDLSATGEAN